jgi:hypothetical protein
MEEKRVDPTSSCPPPDECIASVVIPLQRGSDLLRTEPTIKPAGTGLISGKRTRYPLRALFSVIGRKGDKRWKKSKTLDRLHLEPSVVRLLAMVVMHLEENSSFIDFFMYESAHSYEYFSQVAWICIKELRFLASYIINLIDCCDEYAKEVLCSKTHLGSASILEDVLSIERPIDCCIDGSEGLLSLAVKLIFSTLYTPFYTRAYPHPFNCFDDSVFTHSVEHVPVYTWRSGKSVRTRIIHNVEWIPATFAHDEVLKAIFLDPFVAIHIVSGDQFYHINRYFPEVGYELFPGSNGVGEHLHSSLVVSLQHLLTNLRVAGDDMDNVEIKPGDYYLESTASFDNGSFLTAYLLTEDGPRYCVDLDELVLYNYLCFEKKVPMSLFRFYRPILDAYYQNRDYSIKNALDEVIAYTIKIYSHWFRRTRLGKLFHYLTLSCIKEITDSKQSYGYFFPLTKFQQSFLMTRVEILYEGDDYQSAVDRMFQMGSEIPRYNLRSVRDLFLVENPAFVEALSYVDFSVFDVKQRPVQSEIDVLKVRLANAAEAAEVKRIKKRIGKLMKLGKKVKARSFFYQIAREINDFAYHSVDNPHDFSFPQLIHGEWGSVRYPDNVVEIFQIYGEFQVDGFGYRIDRLPCGAVFIPSPEGTDVGLYRDDALCEKCINSLERLSLLDRLRFRVLNFCHCEIFDSISIDQSYVHEFGEGYVVEVMHRGEERSD